MGIRFEKKTKLNWIRQMEEFLRLLLEGTCEDNPPLDKETIDSAYRDFFNRDRSFFQQHQLAELNALVEELAPEQVRPLAVLLLQDGLMHKDPSLLTNARHILERHMRMTGSMTLEDYGNLSIISNALKANNP